MKQITYEYLKENNLILFECLIGSQAYGMQTPESDFDYKFIYILPEDNILGTNYIEQVTVNKDFVGYEIRRFLELTQTQNPTILEMLHVDERCVTIKHPAFDMILENKDSFLTKNCRNSFGGYAKGQISKSNGLQKKMNWEKDRVKRKDLLDFCYVISGYKTIPWKKWNKERNYNIKHIGAVNLPNAKDVYALFYSENPTLKYKGLIKVKDDSIVSDKPENYGESNQLRLSSIPKGEMTIATITYNKDGYTAHCKDYKEYNEWLENRNTSRYVDVENSNQKIDGKNIAHCVRLIRMATEIGLGQGVQVTRKDAKELLSIRRGEQKLEDIIEWATQAIIDLDDIYEKSTLPKTLNPNVINEILIKIRKEFYKNK